MVLPFFPLLVCSTGSPDPVSGFVLVHFSSLRSFHWRAPAPPVWDNNTPRAEPGDRGSGEGLCCLWKATSNPGNESRAEDADPQQVTRQNSFWSLTNGKSSFFGKKFLEAPAPWDSTEQDFAMSHFWDHSPLLRPSCAMAEGGEPPENPKLAKPPNKGEVKLGWKAF